MAKVILTAQDFTIYDGDGLDPWARTGGTNLKILLKAGAQGVIVGHSEVGDSPEIACKKLSSALSISGFEFLTVLVGESFEDAQRLSDDDLSNLMVQQLSVILGGIDSHRLQQVVVGYEPRWGSRGSGRDEVDPPAAPLIANVVKSLKQYIKQSYGIEIPVIYGDTSR